MYSLCCISNELKKNGYSFKTMTWKRYNELSDKLGPENALQELKSRWHNNALVTKAIINHCRTNKWNYRLSSSLFPIIGLISSRPDNDTNDVLRSIAEDNYDNSVRISIHPDQFNVLASKNNEAIRKTIVELTEHGWLMDMIGTSQSYHNPMNIHVNCSDGDPKEISERFMYFLNLCLPSVKNRLVVENEDKGIWNVETLYNYFYVPYGIPITFDNLHHKCNPGYLSEQEAMTVCASTWGDYKPLFHYSESDTNNKNPRAHANLPTDIPTSSEYDWEIELKAKDEAIRYLYLIELTKEAQELNLGY